MSNNWSPIIYASTYDVDFRLIVKPEDFKQKQIQWAKKYIFETIQIKKGKDWATNLRDYPRWSLFKNGGLTCCIVGVTSMADMFSDSMNQDRCGRPLYAFVGCVTQLSSTSEAQLPPLTIDFFKSIYEKYVGKRWEEKQFQSEKGDKQTKGKYRKYPIGKYDFKLSELPDLNIEIGKIRLFPQPNTEEERNKLLLAAFLHEKHTSICLGLPEIKYASKGIFHNAGLINIKEIKTINSQENLTQKESTLSSTKVASEPKTELERIQEKFSIYESNLEEDFSRKEIKVNKQTSFYESNELQVFLTKIINFFSYLLGKIKRVIKIKK